MRRTGYALLPVASVAETLWAFLDWATQTAPASNEADHALVAGLRARFSALRNTPITVLEQASIGEKVQSLLTQARLHAGLADDAVVADEQPAIVFLDSAVLMFGGLNVDLNSADVNSLVGFLAQCKGTQESPAVAALVEQPDRNAWSHAYEEGYRLAEDLRERLGIDADQLYVDIDQILAQLGVAVVERALATPGIRGVAVAGAAFTPSILINTSSFYNKNAAGKRFTLAHELCHILYDRTRARKISHVSGPWSSARTEKRANAFAAMLLASPSAIRKNLDLDALTSPAVTQLAQSLGIGFTALVEHLYNVDLINDCERDQMRPAH